MRIIKPIMVVAMLCVFTSVNSQIKEIKIGDTVPDIEITDILNYPKEKVKLSDFKGKLVILDFWSFFCGPCIEGLPKMDSLQKLFKNDVVFLPVYPTHAITGKFKQEVDSFWKSNKYTSKTSLPTVIDTVFRKLFGYQVAYQVWIDKDRVLRAKTGENYVNKYEIRQMLAGIYPDWETQVKEGSYKKSVTEYLSRPEFHNINDKNYSFFTSYLKGVATSSHIDTANSQTRISYINTSLSFFFKEFLAVNALLPSNLLLETKDSLRYFSKGYHNEWLRKNGYCYELRLMRKVDRNTLANYVMQDINKFFGLNARLEDRKVSCLIFVKTKKNVVNSKGNDNLSDIIKLNSIPELYERIRVEQNVAFNQGKKILPIVDATNVRSQVKLTFPKLMDFNDISALRKILQSQGFDILRGERLLKMLVVSEQSKK